MYTSRYQVQVDKLLTHHSCIESIAKITRGAPAIKVKMEEVAHSGKSNTRLCASDLPANMKRDWADKFCPLWRNFLGTLNDPWDTDDPTIRAEMQICFDSIFPNSTHGTIGSNDVFYLVVCNPSPRTFPLLLTVNLKAMQRFYDWRGKFAKRAVTILAAFFEAEDVASKSADDKKWRADYAKWALGPGLPFIYAGGDPSVYFFHISCSRIVVLTTFRLNRTHSNRSSSSRS
jgi:hypothetical protein